MILDYGTLLSDEPIELSIGTIRMPKLRNIRKITFDKFALFQIYMKITPKLYYTNNINESKTQYWDSLEKSQQESMNMYNVALIEDDVLNMYLDVFNFFFEEKVIFKDGLFVILYNNCNEIDDSFELTNENTKSIMNEKIFLEVIDLLQQICCIKDYESMDEIPKFKNKKAKKLWERMQKAKEEAEKRKSKERNINLSLPNIISSVAAKSFSLNIINIWDITIFQLYDQFGRLQLDDSHYINSVRLSVWGDEKKVYNPELWHLNTFEKKLK